MYCYLLECGEDYDEVQKYTILSHETKHTTEQLIAEVAEAAVKVISRNIKEAIAADSDSRLRMCSYSTAIWDDVIAMLVAEHGFQEVEYEADLWVDTCSLMKNPDPFLADRDDLLKAKIRDTMPQDMMELAAKHERMWRNR